MKKHKWARVSHGRKEDMCMRCGLTETEARMLLGQDCEEEPSRYLSELEIHKRNNDYPMRLQPNKIGK